MGRLKGSKNKKAEVALKIVKEQEKTELPLLEESQKIVEKGLQEAKEGKIEVENKLTKEQQEKKEKLHNILREINKDKGKNTIVYANEIAPKDKIPFGYQCLDNLTNGGIPIGSVSVIYGSKSVGKTTIAYKMIAIAQKEGKSVIHIDMERSFDPVWAEKFGVDTKSLGYVRCNTAEEALDIIIKVCKEKAVDLVTLDSIQGLSPRGEQYEGKTEKEKSIEDDTMALLARKLSQFFRIAVPYISNAKCAVLMIGQARIDLGSYIKMETLSGGHALLHNARLILRLHRGSKADSPIEKVETEELDKKGNKKIVDKIVGFPLVIKVEKSQISNCVEGTSINVPFHFTEGIQDDYAITE